MSATRSVVLKKGREKAVRNRHHWVFSGAVKSVSEGIENGDIVEVRSIDGELLGHACCNPHGSILARMLSFGSEDPHHAVAQAIREAWDMRQALLTRDTDAYRLINGEADRIPGLVVDVYGDAVVLQAGTAGIDKLKKFVTDEIVKILNPVAVIEKSDSPSRAGEGLPPSEGLLFGKSEGQVSFTEDGMKFRADLLTGQKTGFFLDQRGNRRTVRSMSRGRDVLNLFSYTGGFTVAAASGGAKSVLSVDVSEDALKMAKVNGDNNNPGGAELAYVCADVFSYLRENRIESDFIIVDPPAFAKKKKDIEPACRGYKDINRLVFQGARPGAVVLTCSCSYHVGYDLFQNVVFQAAAEAGRNVRIIGRHRLAEDHPVNIYHPETDYLKSLLLYVS